MIRLDGVSVAFGATAVLESVDLTVDRGELLGLVGPNGAGKTTLLRTINGLLDPDEGTVWVDGDRSETLDAQALSRRIATVPQDSHVGFSFSVEHLVEMGRTPHRSRLDWAGTGDDDPVEWAMKRTEVDHLSERTADELSGGELQRVLLARALAQESDVLVLDEPTASLDINHQIRVFELMTGLVEEGKTAIAAIHDLDLAARFCDRLALLADGSIRVTGQPERVLSDPVLSSAYNTDTLVIENHATGTPSVVGIGTREGIERRAENRVAANSERPADSSDRVAANSDRPADSSDRLAIPSERVHIVGGGSVGADVLRSLWWEGYDVSIGIVPDEDIAAVSAKTLGCPVVSSPPFREPSESVLERVKQYIEQSGVVVTTGGPGDSVTPFLESTVPCDAIEERQTVDPGIAAEWVHAGFDGADHPRPRSDGGTEESIATPIVVSTETELRNKLERSFGRK